MGPPLAENRAAVTKDERSWGGGSFYNLYTTSDGETIALGGAEHKFVENLLNALGRPDLIDHALQAPGPAHEPVRRSLRDAFAQRTLAEWTGFLTPLDVAWSKVKSLHEAITSPLAVACGMRVEDPIGQPHLGIPIKFRQEPGSNRSASGRTRRSHGSGAARSGLRQ